MKNYKLIVTDMDGTVLGENHQITDENKNALKEAEKMGIKVVFATGRFHDSAKDHVNFLEDVMPIISSNGSIIKHPITNKVLYSNFIDRDICLKIMDIIEEYFGKIEKYFYLEGRNTIIMLVIQKINLEKKKKNTSLSIDASYGHGCIRDAGTLRHVPPQRCAPQWHRSARGACRWFPVSAYFRSVRSAEGLRC